MSRNVVERRVTMAAAQRQAQRGPKYRHTTQKFLRTSFPVTNPRMT